MGWEYWIMSRQDATAHPPQRTTPVGPFRAIHDWITSHAPDWHPYGVEPDRLDVPIGRHGHVVVHLITARHNEMLRDALREQERRGDRSYDVLREFMRTYVPRDDEPVVVIRVEGRGVGDMTLFAQLAGRLGAVALCGATSQVLTPDEWLRQCEAYREEPDPEPFEDVITWRGMWWDTERHEKPRD